MFNIKAEMKSFLTSIKKRKEVYYTGFLLLTVILVFTYIFCMNFRDISIGVYADGEFIGTVEDPSDISAVLDDTQTEIANNVYALSSDELNITYSFCHGKTDTLNYSELYDKIYSLRASQYTEAYGIFADGHFVASSCDKASLQLVSSSVQASLNTDTTKLVSELTIEKIIVPNSYLKTQAEIFHSLVSGLECQNDLLNSEDDEEKLIFSYSEDADKAYAPNIDTSNEIFTNNYQAEIEIDPVDDESEIYSIPYTTVYEKTDELFIGEFKVKQPGRTGTGKITYGFITSDASLWIKVVKKDSILSTPVDKIILVGTKPYISTETTGEFDLPIKDWFIYTDMFGSRVLQGKYDFHQGVDFACPKGTPIYAADGGEVILAGQNNTFGLCVIIQHDNGYRTLYAHMSSINAEVGDRVYKGEHIGNVGNTGKSYGYHLHFEIQYDGGRVDPMDYLPN